MLAQTKLYLCYACLVFGARRNQSRIIEEKNASKENANASVDYGDITCMTWSGGSCLMSSCMADRGPVECVSGRCICTMGYCANAKGQCLPSYAGKWIGTYAIRFLNAHDPTTPYVGVEHIKHDGMFSSSENDEISAVGVQTPQWKIAQTPSGFVRLESVKMPGHVFTIYDSRRRSLLQTRAANNNIRRRLLNTTDSEHGSSSKATMTEDTDLWPRLQKLEDTSPIGATFQMRELDGGIEFWDPERGVALASSEKDGWFNDYVADRGVSECYPPGVFSIGCDKRELMKFEPNLPAGAVSRGDRKVIRIIRALYWWQILLLIGCFLLCIFGPHILVWYWRRS